MIHDYAHVERTWSSVRCTQPERGRGGEMASTPGLRWCTRGDVRPLLERTLSTAGLHHRLQKDALRSPLSPPRVKVHHSQDETLYNKMRSAVG